jgi:hypothetical protein
VNAVMPAERQFMHWSEAAITWGREDHPRLSPSPGEYALVLDPVMCSNTHTCKRSEPSSTGYGSGCTTQAPRFKSPRM